MLSTIGGTASAVTDQVEAGQASIPVAMRLIAAPTPR